MAGVIHLLVIEATPAQYLEIGLKGTESAQWKMQRDKRSAKKSVKSKFLRWQIPYYWFSEGRLKPGHYTFPFSFRLPQTLPGTFHYSADVEAHIFYSLFARIVGIGSFIQDTRIEVAIAQQVSIDSQLSPDRTAHIKSGCITDNGQVQLCAETDKTHYRVGDTVEAKVTVDNSKCTLAVTGVRCSLLRIIRLKDSAGDMSVVVSTAASSVSQQAIAPNAETVVRVRVRLPLHSEETCSVQGQFVECMLAIKNEVLLDTCTVCYGDSPDHVKNVTVYPSLLPSTAPPELPPEWQVYVRK